MPGWRRYAAGSQAVGDLLDVWPAGRGVAGFLAVRHHVENRCSAKESTFAGETALACCPVVQPANQHVGGRRSHLASVALAKGMRNRRQRRPQARVAEEVSRCCCRAGIPSVRCRRGRAGRPGDAAGSQAVGDLLEVRPADRGVTSVLAVLHDVENRRTAKPTTFALESALARRPVVQPGDQKISRRRRHLARMAAAKATGNGSLDSLQI